MICGHEQPCARLPAPNRTRFSTRSIKPLSGFDPTEFVDRYEEALVGMLKEEQAGHPIVATEAAKPRNVVNLMEALRKSVEEEAKREGTPEAIEPKAKARAASKERKGAAAPKKAPARRAKA
jgi:hypothetical protein